MDKTFEQKRKHPRILVNVPLTFKTVEDPKHGSGIVIDASEAGLLIQTFKDMSTGKRIVIQVSFSEGDMSSRLSAIAEIIWKDLYAWEDLEGYQYGLKFIQILEEDYLKLKEILGNQSRVEEVRFAKNSDEREGLIIRAEL